MGTATQLVSENRYSQEVGLTRMTVWQILRNDLDLHRHTIVLTQELKRFDHVKRVLFSNCTLGNLKTIPTFEIFFG